MSTSTRAAARFAANFYNAMFLIVFLLLATDLISMIPLAAIAAILIYVGWRLCEYRVFSRTYAIGREQMLIFLVTVGAILATDLLWGILIGMAAEILMLAYLLTPSFRTVLTGRLSLAQSLDLLGRNLASLFRDPVIKVHATTAAITRSRWVRWCASTCCISTSCCNNFRTTRRCR